LKIGSYVREEIGWDQTGTTVAVVQSAPGSRFDRTDSSELNQRTRAVITVDLRTQTEYGTLRSYLEGGFDASGQFGGAPNNDTVFYDRGFIQFAGLTAGRIRSFFDINSPFTYSYMTQATSADSNTFRGLWGLAWTAQFGNGVSASISLEDGGSSAQGNNLGTNRSRGHSTVNLSMASQWGLGTVSYDNEGWLYPDVIGALRIDQAWGYAQISAALHEANAGYYQSGGTTLATGIQNNGHPGNATGFAIAGGFTINDIFGWKGDTFSIQANYAQGASGYVVTNNSAGLQGYGSGNNAGFGWVTDGVFVTGSNVELTTAWGINGGVQHIWNPKWKSSLYGGYVEIDYDGTATAMICPGGAAGTAAPTGTALTGVTNCAPNFSFWQVGSRTQWNPHPDLDIGVDIVWSHLNTAFAGTATLAANGARPGGVYTIGDQDNLAAVFRIQRNFLP